MSIRKQIAQCRKYETNRLPKYLQYLRDEFRGLRRDFELELERGKYSIREGLVEKIYV